MAIGNEETSDRESDIPEPSKVVTATFTRDKQRHLPLKKHAVKGNSFCRHLLLRAISRNVHAQHSCSGKQGKLRGSCLLTIYKFGSI